MCWAACDRLSRIAVRLELDNRAAYWRERADIIHATILEKAWSADVGAFTAAFGGTDLDASVLLMAEIDPETGELWGNFPQTYCMVGIINSAALLSKPWAAVT